VCSSDLSSIVGASSPPSSEVAASTLTRASGSAVLPPHEQPESEAASSVATIVERARLERAEIMRGSVLASGVLVASASCAQTERRVRLDVV
jgi:hypothetical protein